MFTARYYFKLCRNHLYTRQIESLGKNSSYLLMILPRVDPEGKWRHFQASFLYLSDLILTFSKEAVGLSEHRNRKQLGEMCLARLSRNSAQPAYFSESSFEFSLFFFSHPLSAGKESNRPIHTELLMTDNAIIMISLQGIYIWEKQFTKALTLKRLGI